MDLKPSPSSYEIEEVSNEINKKRDYLTLGEALSKKKLEDKEESSNVLPPLFVKAHKDLLKLYALIDEGTDTITQLRNEAIQREISKQKNEEMERYNLDCYLAKIEKEASEEYKKLDEKWDEIEKIEDPCTLNKETIAHREKCNVLLEGKKKEINHLNELLKQKDGEFVKEIENQGVDIDLLLNRVEEQTLNAREAFSKELDALEEIIDEEKGEMLKLNQNKWEKLMDDKEKVDKAFIEKICNIVDEHRQPIILAEKEHLEYKRKMRSKLDKYVNDLIVQTDFLKSICILNIEKLNYNLHLLFNKQTDNKMIKDTCKKHNSRVGNKLSQAKKTVENRKSAMLKQMGVYSTKMEKFLNQINAIDKRCDDLTLNSTKTYFDLWNFMEKEVKFVIDQIAICEKIIFEECLLMNWERPDYDRPKPPSYIAAYKLYLATLNKNKLEFNNPPRIETSQLIKFSKLVINSLSYSLVNQKKNSEFEGLSKEGQLLIELSNILEVLGIKTDREVRSLMKYIIAYTVCPECSSHLQKKASLVGLEYLRQFSMRAVSKRTIETHKKISMEQEEEMPDVGKGKLDLISKVANEEAKLIKRDEKYFLRNDPFTLELFKTCEQDTDPGSDIRNRGCDPNENNEMELPEKESCFTICDNPTHHPFVNPLDLTMALEEFNRDISRIQRIETKQNVNDIMQKERLSPVKMMIPEEITDYWESYLTVFGQEKRQLWEMMIITIQNYQKALQKIKICPVCLMPSRKTELKENKVLCEMVSENNIPDIKVELCHTHRDRLASHWCADGDGFICEECVRGHGNLVSTRDHKIMTKEEHLMSITFGEPKSVFPCTLHPQNQLTIVCHTCRAMTCRDCQLELHREHKYDFVADKIDETKLEVYRFYRKIEYHSVFLTSALKKISDREKKIEMNKLNIVAQIKNESDAIIEIVKKRCKELMISAILKSNEKLEECRTGRVGLEKDLQSLKLCSNFVKTVLNKSSDPVVFYMKDLMLSHMERISNSLGTGSESRVPNAMDIINLRFVPVNLQELKMSIFNFGLIDMSPCISVLDTTEEWRNALATLMNTYAGLISVNPAFKQQVLQQILPFFRATTRAPVCCDLQQQRAVGEDGGAHTELQLPPPPAHLPWQQSYRRDLMNSNPILSSCLTGSIPAVCQSLKLSNGLHQQKKLAAHQLQQRGVMAPSDVTAGPRGGNILAQLATCSISAHHSQQLPM